MTKSSTRISMLVVLAVLTMGAPAFADDTPAGVASDVGAVQKDNTAAAKNSVQLAQDRAAKAKDKATGNLGGQAVDSMSIGADKTMQTEKQGETSVDKKVLNSDVNSATSK